MQIKLFTIPISDSGAPEEELNAFLKTHKIVSVDSELANNKDGAWWCFCVRYLEQAMNALPERKVKVDYRQVLDDVTFQKFVKLREIRKRVASEEGLSAFIVFTDEELAELAKLDEISVKSMLSIKGIGEKKIERFARYFITTPESDEAQGEIG
uniref:HRDC n=1 Tax=Chlorobium chlorochromatii (strain CaD3) TaxID=340177 RepID=Q3APY0_CHLCH